MKKNTVIFMLVFLSSALSFNYVGASKNDDSDTIKKTSNLEPSSAPKFNDVPIPTGFKLLPLDSYTFESAGIRVGVLRYQGKANLEQVINFYKEQMSMYNWNLLNVIEFGNSLMNFEREDETCIIDLLPKGSAILITVSLGPKTKILPKPAEKPIR